MGSCERGALARHDECEAGQLSAQHRCHRCGHAAIPRALSPGRRYGKIEFPRPTLSSAQYLLCRLAARSLTKSQALVVYDSANSAGLGKGPTRPHPTSSQSSMRRFQRSTSELTPPIHVAIASTTNDCEITHRLRKPAAFH